MYKKIKQRREGWIERQIERERDREEKNRHRGKESRRERQ